MDTNMKWIDPTTDTVHIPISHLIRWSELQQPIDKLNHGIIESKDMWSIGLFLVLFAAVCVTATVGIGYTISWIIRGCP